MNKIILAVCIVSGVLFSCKDSQTKASSEKITQDNAIDTDFEEGSTQTVRPKIAELSFIIDNKKYEMSEKSEELSIIPFAMYKPLDEEEGRTSEESLIWMKGKSSEDQSKTILAEFTLEKKLTKGSFICKNGRLEAYPDFKYLDIIEMNLEVTGVQDVTFMPELKGYSVKIEFSGKVKEAGANGRELNVKQGNINIKY